MVNPLRVNEPKVTSNHTLPGCFFYILYPRKYSFLLSSSMMLNSCGVRIIANDCVNDHSYEGIPASGELLEYNKLCITNRLSHLGISIGFLNLHNKLF